MRIVVCGSRDYSNRGLLNAVLSYVVGDETAVIVDGVCPYGGADELAHQWALGHGHDSERFPPATRTADGYHARNRAMVDSEPDVVVAFVNKPLAESRGTAYTVNYARSKGIETIVIEDMP